MESASHQDSTRCESGVIRASRTVGHVEKKKLSVRNVLE